MPHSAPTPCRHQGCRALVKQSAGYCEKHKRKAWQRKEGTTTQRGYGASWRRLRKLVIQRDSGLCQPCLMNNRITQFNAVDHIIPKSKGGTDEISNLQCICDICHKQKTSSRDSK